MRMTMKKTCYRVWICLVFPLIPLWLLAGHLVMTAPEYWRDLCDMYRMFPKAFKKGSPV